MLAALNEWAKELEPETRALTQLEECRALVGFGGLSDSLGLSGVGFAFALITPAQLPTSLPFRCA